MTISAELPKEAGDLVMKAIEIAMAVEASENDDSPSEDSFFARQADALVEIAKAYLAGGSGDRTTSADHYQVMVHVDESALRDEGGKSEMPIESVRRIMCDASIVPVVEDADGTPLDVGRKQRVVSPPLRRALLSRDKHCRYPGCSHDKWLDAHHVMHWADGGETSLANTLLLCSKHHRLLHEGGFTIQKNFEGEWYFKHANGRPIDDARLYHYREADPSRDGLRRVEQDEVREPPRLYAVI